MILNVQFKSFPKTYRDLIALYPPRPLHNDSDLAKATQIIDTMAGHDLNADQDDYLDVISTLVELYENEHHPIQTRRMRPIEALRYLLEQSGMNASDLGRLLGSRDLGSKILRGERGLSMAHISKLAAHFAVSPTFFIPPAPKSAGKTSRPAFRTTGRRSFRS